MNEFDTPDKDNVYENEEELLDAYRTECIDSYDFDEFLDDNYRSSDIFDWGCQQKEEVLAAYKENLANRAKDWASENAMM